MPITDKDLVSRLEIKRKEMKGLTQGELASKVGISLSTYGNMISGGKAILCKTFVACVEALDISMEDFLSELLAESKVPGILSETMDYQHSLKGLREYYEEKLADKEKVIKSHEEHIKALQDHITSLATLNEIYESSYNKSALEKSKD